MPELVKNKTLPKLYVLSPLMNLLYFGKSELLRNLFSNTLFSTDKDLAITVEILVKYFFILIPVVL